MQLRQGSQKQPHDDFHVFCVLGKYLNKNKLFLKGPQDWTLILDPCNPEKEKEEKEEEKEKEEKEKGGKGEKEKEKGEEKEDEKEEREEKDKEEGLTDNEPQDILPHLGGLWLGVCFWKWEIDI